MADSSIVNGPAENSTTITPEDASNSNLETSSNSNSHLSQQASSLSQQNHQQQQQQQQPLQNQAPDFSQFNCDIILRQILNEKKLNLMRSPEVTNFFKQIADKSFMSPSTDSNSQDANNLHN